MQLNRYVKKKINGLYVRFKEPIDAFCEGCMVKKLHQFIFKEINVH